MKVVLLFLGAWLAGLVTYVATIALFYGQAFSGADLKALLLTSFVAFGVAFMAVYLPALLGVRRFLRGVRPVWPFPAVAIALGLVPTLLICFAWGGGVRSLLSPEANLFYAMFGVVGLIVGLGFASIYRPRASA